MTLYGVNILFNIGSVNGKMPHMHQIIPWTKIDLAIIGPNRFKVWWKYKHCYWRKWKFANVLCKVAAILFRQILICSTPNQWHIWMTNLSLQWRHNGCDGVSNHRDFDCLLNHLFRRRSKKKQSSTSLAFVGWIHRSPVNSPHMGPVTRKMFPFDDVIMFSLIYPHLKQVVI